MLPRYTGIRGAVVFRENEDTRCFQKECSSGTVRRRPNVETLPFLHSMDRGRSCLARGESKTSSPGAPIGFERQSSSARESGKEEIMEATTFC